MNKSKLKLCRILIMIAVVASISWSIAISNAVIPILAVAGGMGLMYLCGRQVKQVVKDERNYRIIEKASRFTIGVFGPMTAVASAVLIALSKGSSVDLRIVGFTLAYTKGNFRR